MTNKETIIEKWNEFIIDTRKYGAFPERLAIRIEDFWMKQITRIESEKVKEIKEMIEGN